MNNEFHRSIKEEIELRKEQIINEIKESEKLIKRTDLFLSIYNEHIEYEKRMIGDGKYILMSDERQLITSLNSMNEKEKLNAIEQLILIVKTSPDSEKRNYIKEVLTEQLKNDEKVAKKILNGFFDLYLYSGKINTIRWAAKFHPSDEIKEHAQGMLEIISKIEGSAEKEEWKKRFKEKIKKYRKRNEKYKKLKEELEMTPEQEKLLEFKTGFLERLCPLISINSTIATSKIIDELEQVVENKTIEAISNSNNGEIKNIDIFDIYEISVKLAIIYLKEESLAKRKEEVNSILIEKLGRKQ